MGAYRAISTATSTTGSSTRTISISAQAGDLLVVCAATQSGTGISASSMTDDQSGTWQISSLPNAQFTGGSALAYGIVYTRNQIVASTATINITINYTDTQDATCLACLAFTGFTRVGSGAQRQSKVTNNGSAGGTPAPAFTSSALTGNVTFGVIVNASNPAGMTTPTNWTERGDVGEATPTTGLEVVTRDSGFTGTTVTWGSTSATSFGAIIVELDTSAATSTFGASNTLAALTSTSAFTTTSAFDLTATLADMTAVATAEAIPLLSGSSRIALRLGLGL